MPVAVLGALVVCLLAGCTGPTRVREDLLQASSDATAAVHSAQLVLGLLGGDRTTRSHAVTVFVDMTRQLDDASTSVSDLTIDDPAQRPDRDQVLVAVHSAQLAVLSGRDCLQTSTSCAGAIDRLREAEVSLGVVETKLRAEQ